MPNNLSKVQLEEFKRNLRAMVCNRLVYPNTIVDLAKDRPLTPEEARKARECLHDTISLVETEITIFIYKMTEIYVH